MSHPDGPIEHITPYRAAGSRLSGHGASDVLVTPLAELSAQDLPLAGGKGANLGELIRAGFPVPEGFVVTTAAYAAVLAGSALGTKLDAFLAYGLNRDGAEDAASLLRDAFAAAEIPATIRDEIAAHYRAYHDAPVAVRSSATAEDLPGAAFAGQQDTFLNVVGEEAVLEAVRKCWASLWTDRAIAYRRREDIDPHDVAIAVVVQRMVPADAAGVLFTANPVTGRRDEIVIDAGWGLGEAVVSGLVTPDHYVLAPDGGLREWSTGTAVAEPGAEAEDTGPARVGREVGRLLGPAQLRELADIASRAARHFGRPQDLEWALSGGQLFVVQARPMTALPPEPARQPDAMRLNILQRKLGPFFLEMFQQRPYPLDVDGWLKHVIIAMLHRMAGSVGVQFPGLSALLPEEDGVVVRLVPPVPHPTLRVLAAPLSVARRVRRFDPSEWMQDDRFTAFLRSAEDMNRIPLPELDWAQLVAHVRRIFAVTGAVADLRVSYLPASFLPQLPMRIILFALGRADLASTLLAGAETRTEQANRSLERLANLVRGDAELRRAFDELEPADLLSTVRTDPRFAPFDEELRAFLEEYGHRETVSLVLSSSPTWSDAPEAVLGLVKVLIPARVATSDPTGNALRELLEHPALRNPWLRRHTLRAVNGSKIGTAFRDDSHFYLTLLLPALRRTYAEMGERLLRAGIINQAADVYHLRFEELSGMRDPATLADLEKRRYGDIVASRAVKRRAREGTPLLTMETLSVPSQAVDGVILTGMGASRGSATGRVRIIRDASAFGTLQNGEVLVCAYTNPAWTPLFQRASAVVVDTGGMGSHAAIVAREYGIPAVMGTGNGTVVLTDGQLVTVDGTVGRVIDVQG
jgi:rifampicin phosphotransferase